MGVLDIWFGASRASSPDEDRSRPALDRNQTLLKNPAEGTTLLGLRLQSARIVFVHFVFALARKRRQRISRCRRTLGLGLVQELLVMLQTLVGCAASAKLVKEALLR